MITSKRMINGNHRILKDGQPVGEAWRYPKASQGTRDPRPDLRFGMRLDGYLWLHGQPVKRGAGGGFSTVAVPRLCDAVALAAKVLEQSS